VRPADRLARLQRSRVYLCLPIRLDLEDFLDAVLPAGIDLVQLRDKHADDQAVLAAAAVVGRAAERHDVLFVLNDRPDLAVAVDADGVHVGQDDMPPAQAREVVGPDRIIGRSTHSVAQVDAAQGEDVDYFAVGPVSPTPTKPGREGIGLDPLRHASAVATRPWFVTGGMAPDTVDAVLPAGVPGIVVVRAITEAAAPAAITAALAARMAEPDVAAQPATAGRPGPTA